VDLYAVQYAVPVRKPKTQNKPQKQTSKNNKPTTKTKKQSKNKTTKKHQEVGSLPAKGIHA